MKRKSLLLIFTILFACILTSISALAEESLPVEAQEILQSSTVLETDSISLQVVESNLGITAVVRNMEELKAAFASDDVTGAYLFNDIEITETLYLYKDFKFEVLAGEVIIYTRNTSDRFMVIEGPDILVDFGDVIFDGYSSNLGMVIRNDVHIVGGTFQNLREAMILRGGITVENTNFLNNKNTATLINVQPSVRSDVSVFRNCTISGNRVAPVISNVIFDSYSNLTLENCTITDNEAKGNIIAVRSGYDYAIIDSCTITDNKSESSVILLRSPTQILNSEISRNRGDYYGAIHGNIASISVDEHTTFSDNSANNGYYIINPDDIALHNENIKATQFSGPFRYAYNNYDIGYTSGINVNNAVVAYFHLSKSSPGIYDLASTTPGTALPALPAAPSLEGYQFVGWYDADGNHFDQSTILTEGIDLYAAWIIL